MCHVYHIKAADGGHDLNWNDWRSQANVGVREIMGCDRPIPHQRTRQEPIRNIQQAANRVVGGVGDERLCC